MVVRPGAAEGDHFGHGGGIGSPGDRLEGGYAAAMEAPVRIEIDRGALGLAWEDGTSSSIPAAVLRAACPCAGCRAGAPSAGHPTIESARIVGDYAVGIVFGPDGHATGIFTYDLLRSLAAES